MEEKQQFTKQEMLEKLKDLKSRPMDPYGLTKYDKASDTDVSQITEFDSFIFFDSIQLLNLTPEQLKEFKNDPATVSKFNSETNLYAITIGDKGTEYYNYATMLNRLTNEIYFNKINGNAKLLRQFFRNLNTNIEENIREAVRRVNIPEYEVNINSNVR